MNIEREGALLELGWEEGGGGGTLLPVLVRRADGSEVRGTDGVELLHRGDSQLPAQAVHQAAKLRPDQLLHDRAPLERAVHVLKHLVALGASLRGHKQEHHERTG